MVTGNETHSCIWYTYNSIAIFTDYCVDLFALPAAAEAAHNASVLLPPLCIDNEWSYFTSYILHTDVSNVWFTVNSECAGRALLVGGL